jgi:hypothetical protein
LAAAINISGGENRPTQKCRVLIAKHLRLVGAEVLEGGGERDGMC